MKRNKYNARASVKNIDYCDNKLVINYDVYLTRNNSFSTTLKEANITITNKSGNVSYKIENSKNVSIPELMLMKEHCKSCFMKFIERNKELEVV